MSETTADVKPLCDCPECHGEGFIGPDGATCACIIAGCRKRHRRDEYLIAPAPVAPVGGVSEDTALLDWADAEGHYDASYNSLRDELRDRGRKLPLIEAVRKLQPLAREAAKPGAPDAASPSIAAGMEIVSRMIVSRLLLGLGALERQTLEQEVAGIIDTFFSSPAAAAPPADAGGQARIEWFTPQHYQRREALSEELDRLANELAPTDNCNRCDSSVGFVCECCASASAMKDAARYMRSMNADAPQPSPVQPKVDPYIEQRMAEIEKAWLAGDGPSHVDGRWMLSVIRAMLDRAAAPSPVQPGDAGAVRKALEEAESFIAVMFGDMNGKVPETIDTPLRIPVKLGDIMRAIRAALASSPAAGADAEVLAWLDEVEARANAATPGPWTLEDDGYAIVSEPEPQGSFVGAFGLIACVVNKAVARVYGSSSDGAKMLDLPDDSARRIRNGTFIAHARTDVPRFVSLLRARLAGGTKEPS